MTPRAQQSKFPSDISAQLFPDYAKLVVTTEGISCQVLKLKTQVQKLGRG